MSHFPFYVPSVILLIRALNVYKVLAYVRVHVCDESVISS
jgi:hypothetical protein